MFVHKFDKRSAASIGSRAERVFIGLAAQRGYKVSPSTTDQNRINKVDYFLQKNDLIKGVDVKARKKICAYDADYNDEWTWVEFKNADGFNGWLYGDCDYIAFEKKDYFLVVDRISLAVLCESLIDFNKEFVRSCSNAKYRIYQRRDLEQISLVKTKDIQSLKRCMIWNKN